MSICARSCSRICRTRISSGWRGSASSTAFCRLRKSRACRRSSNARWPRSRKHADMVTAFVRIRPAEARDLPDLSRLGAILIDTHHHFDPKRFMGPERVRDYPAFLAEQIAADDAAVLVAEDADGVLGYVFAAIEPASLKELREEAGYIHDLVVDERARSRGVASRLMAAGIEWLQQRKVPRVLLTTATQNETAKRLFTKLGFARTMVEFTKELRR